MNIDIRQIDPFTLPSVRFEQRNELPAISAIYFVIVESEILYIGRATNLQGRWHAHHRTKQIEAYDGAVLAWYAFNDLKKPDAERLERACITLFQPLLNDRGVPDEFHGRSGRNTEKYAYPLPAFSKSSRVYQKLVGDSERSGLPISTLIVIRLGDYYKGWVSPEYQ